MPETHRGRKSVYDRLAVAPWTDLADQPKRKKIAVRPPESAPAHLSPEMQAWWASVVAGYELDPHHLHLLRLAAEAFDRAQGAREQLAREGITVVDGKGVLRVHPATGIERDARAAFAKLVRQLGLDPAAPDGRIALLPRRRSASKFRPCCSPAPTR